MIEMCDVKMEDGEGDREGDGRRGLGIGQSVLFGTNP